MYGPPNTIYEGGYFLIKIDFKEEYWNYGFVN